MYSLQCYILLFFLRKESILNEYYNSEYKYSYYDLEVDKVVVILCDFCVVFYQ